MGEPPRQRQWWIAATVVALLLAGIWSASRPWATAQARTPEPLGASGSWKLVFDDNFNGRSLDRSHWSTCYVWACTNSGNNELEWYTPAGVTVSGGALHLTARARPAGGNPYKPYTSGMIQSDHKFSFRYGFVQARVEVPAGKGLWPAVWMLPTNLQWPPEIDLIEYWGDRPRRILMNVFAGGTQGAPTQFVGPDFSAGYHTFGLNWEPGSITWYVDGVVRKHSTASISQPMYLLANLAVSGSDPPDAATTFPASFDVSSIRVWERSAG